MDGTMSEMSEMSEHDFQTLLASIPDSHPNDRRPWDLSNGHLGVGGSVSQDRYLGGISGLPSSVDQPLPDVPLSSNNGMAPHGLEPHPFLGLGYDQVSSYPGDQPQWQDFNDLNIADAWDSLPSTFQFDDFLSLPESPTGLPPNSNGETTGDESKARKRPRIPLEAKKLLEASFEQHRHDPYLQKSDLKELADATNLSLRQIRTFFANARVRKLAPVASRSPSVQDEHSVKSTPNHEKKPYVAKRRRHSKTSSSFSSVGSVGVDISSRSATTQQDPMQRFLSSSPEDEGLSEDSVRKAAASFSKTNAFTRPRMAKRESSKTDTISVSDTALSSNSGSSSSLASVDSATHRGPRRGRKRRRDQSSKQPKTVIRVPSDPSKIYQCSFCTSDFTQKYDWRRHEESVHFPQKEWICMPDGPAYKREDGIECCILCNEPSTQSSHLETHNCATCLSNPRAERTFTRKDKLLQHIAQVHKISQFEFTNKPSWCRPVQHNITIKCGICGAQPATWAERSDHLADHFAQGQGMQYWIGPPGGIVANTGAHGDTQASQLHESVERPDLLQKNRTTCPLCPDVLATHLAALYHKRQAHNYYCVTDQTAPYGCPTPNVAASPVAPRQVSETAFTVQIQDRAAKPYRLTERGSSEFENSSAFPDQMQNYQNNAYGGGGLVPFNPLLPNSTSTITPNSSPTTSMPFTKPSRIAALKASRDIIEFPARGLTKAVLPPNLVGENGAPKPPDWGEGSGLRVVGGTKKTGKAVWGPWGPG